MGRGVGWNRTDVCEPCRSRHAHGCAPRQASLARKHLGSRQGCNASDITFMLFLFIWSLCLAQSPSGRLLQGDRTDGAKETSGACEHAASTAGDITRLLNTLHSNKVTSVCLEGSRWVSAETVSLLCSLQIERRFACSALVWPTTTATHQNNARQLV